MPLNKCCTCYRERYIDLNVHEKFQEVHGIGLRYTWVKTALQTAGLVKRQKSLVPRKRRPHRALPGQCCRSMAAFITGSATIGVMR